MGYSFGGYVAFEVARQLTAQGERVEHVVLWDSLLESDDMQRTPMEIAAFLARKALRPTTWRDRRWVTVRIKYVGELLRHTTTRMAARVSRSNGDAAGISHQVLAEQLVRVYRPGQYDGRVSLLSCTASGESVRVKPTRNYGQWAAVVRPAHFAVHEFACGHVDVFQEPWATAFAERTVGVLNALARTE